LLWERGWGEGGLSFVSQSASDTTLYDSNFPMGLKIIESFDSSFSLDPDLKASLFELLTAEAFRQQIAQELHCPQVEFTELLFQPIPYSTTTPKGMPAEFEQFHNLPDYAIINVPPNFMFKAKVFKPSRLCAIYRKVSH
jgi:hypothetical protein